MEKRYVRGSAVARVIIATVVSLLFLWLGAFGCSCGKVADDVANILNDPADNPVDNSGGDSNTGNPGDTPAQKIKVSELKYSAVPTDLKANVDITPLIAEVSPDKSATGSFSAKGLPFGFTIDASSGVISGSPKLPATAATDVEVTFTANGKYEGVVKTTLTLPKVGVVDPDTITTWLPYPDKADVLLVHAHPDDESIFFGGTVAYYTRIMGAKLVSVSMVTDLFTHAPGGSTPRVPSRETELKNAVWNYGKRYLPIMMNLRDSYDIDTNDIWRPEYHLDKTWDAWDSSPADLVVQDTNKNGIPDGREVGARLVAEVIRRYKPDLVLTHDYNGEYGHDAHRATALVTTDAIGLAADGSVNIEDLPPWQVKKFYVHLYDQNKLFHHWHDRVKGKRMIDYAWDGLNEHKSQGPGDRVGVASVYEQPSKAYQEFHKYPSEHWGLHTTTVGDDARGTPFDITLNNGTTRSYDATWSKGNFYQNLYK